MKREGHILASLAIFAIYQFCHGNAQLMSQCDEAPGDVYNFSGPALDGLNTIHLSDYKGKVILLINVATYWGGTSPNYLGLNALYTKFGHDLPILAVPCNQFAYQEPGKPQEILNGIRYVRPGNNYLPSASISFFAKSNVNGDQAMPIYDFLKTACPPTSIVIGDPSILFYSPIKTTDITWNFEKFLISRTGQPLYRFHPSVEFDVIIPFIQQALNQTIPSVAARSNRTRGSRTLGCE